MAFNALLADRWIIVHAEHPSEGRRQIKRRLAHEFWSLPHEEKARLEERAIAEQDRIRSALESLNDNDEEDELDTPGVGILVRTDFTDDDAWSSFCDVLRDSERDLLEDRTENGAENANGVAEVGSDVDSDEDNADDDVEMQPTSNGHTSSNGLTPSPPSIFALVNPDASDPLQAKIMNVSNLRALRLFNDVNIVPTLSPPQGTPRIRGNRLVDYDRYVETYTGNLIWLYDAQSNSDGSVRLVSQRGEIYGAATGDSWRPRASFLPELQINLFTSSIKIDFGGEDRWDFRERQRNFGEVETGILPE